VLFLAQQQLQQQRAAAASHAKPAHHPSLMDCRRLFLRDYEVWINIGVHDFEKKGEQRVLINVDLFVPLALSTPQADKLDEVLDYDFIRRSIAERVSRGHVHLQETLADDVLRKLMLAHPKVRAARVSTEKPDVYPDCDAVGVRSVRHQGRPHERR
jgi:dihydroneopterin aldolase